MVTAIELFDKLIIDLPGTPHAGEFTEKFREFIRQYADGAVFMHALANGNLEIAPPGDPLHRNYLIAQYKQLHSNLRHFSWQMQQISKGDLKQKVNFLGEFSVTFNNLIEALRVKKEMEEKIRVQNEQLQYLVKEKDKIFSIIAHDLKNPFNAIIGFSNLLAEQVREKDLDGIESYAEIIQQSSYRALDLLMNLLEWARSQTGRMNFNPEKFDITGLISEVLLLLSSNADQKGITIDKTLPAESWVNADKAMISTVLRNLISNAIKFTKPEGRINITVTATEQGVTIAVQDNGVGIPNATLGRLFSLEGSGSTPGTNDEQGTGLGLILCREFIEKHGGNISVESEVGKGSCFTFILPNVQ
jgi:signal transduction histidine kinase